MNDHEKEQLFFVFIAIILFTGILLAVRYGGYQLGLKEMRTQAIERNYGEYEADKEGNTTFRWIERNPNP